MLRKYTKPYTLEFLGQDIEFQAVVQYTVEPGCPASYEEPANDPTVLIESITVKCFASPIALPPAIIAAIETDADLLQELLITASEDDIAAESDAADAKREDRGFV